MKRDKYIEERERFCTNAINNKMEAAKELRAIATGLENCKTNNDIISALAVIFAVSERTIERHFEK